jgi:transposase
MTYMSGHDRSQILLLPEAVDDYVGLDNPERFIDASVDGLDLAEASFSGVEPKVTGRPGYAPADLLKLYIYLKPDFKTIADFRRDNRTAFRQVFREFVLLCRQLDLFGRELLAVDGTRIKAVNNKERNFTRASLTQFIKAADAELEDDLERLDKSDGTESGKDGSRVKNLAKKIVAIRERRERHKNLLAGRTRAGRARSRSPTPTAGRWQRIRARADSVAQHVAVGYHVQIALDAKHKLIVEQQVTNQVMDMGLLAQTAEPAKEVLGAEHIAVVVDRGHFKIEDIETCEKAAIDPYVPRPQRGPSIRARRFRKDEFSYDPTSDSVLCPAASVFIPIRLL